MRMLTWFLFLPLCLSCGYAFVFSSVRGNVKEPQGQAPCGGHFRIRQNLPEQAQGWLASKWLWLLFVVALYAILKFRGGQSEKSKVSVASFFLFLCVFREGTGGRKRKKHPCVRQTSIGCLSSTPRLNLQPRHVP